ncbi:TPA: hypothetical protein ACOEEB_000611 [Enterobacter asburiae]
MSIKNLVEMIKRNGLLASMPQLEELYQVAIENELKLAESQREFRAADATIENMQMQVEKLAAENAGLKAAHPQPFGPVMMKALDAYEKHQDETPETGMLDAFFILRDSIRADTTATDAFLAEVRAQGVEMFADDLLCPDLDVAIREFAAQLRKGVQS